MLKKVEADMKRQQEAQETIARSMGSRSVFLPSTWLRLPAGADAIVIHTIVVPAVLPQLGVLGVLGGRVPLVLRDLKFIILLAHLCSRACASRLVYFPAWGGPGTPPADVAAEHAGARASFHAASNRRFLRVRLGRVGGLGLVAHGGPLLDRVDRVVF